MDQSKQNIEPINTQAAQEKRMYWNRFSSVYTKYLQTSLSQFCVPLYNLTRAHKSRKHLDVGCGSGLGMLYLSSMYSDPQLSGRLVVMSDFSPQMIETLASRYKDAGFMTNKSNSFFTSLEQLDPKEGLEFDKQEKGVHIKGYVANNECLPFASEQFQSYTANLSLMLVPNHMNQLRECYRVLKVGGIAGFSMWGRKENSPFFTFLMWVLKSRVGIVPPQEERTNFHLGDKDKTIEDFKSVGFKNVRGWYQKIVFNYTDGGEYFDMFAASPTFKNLVPEEKIKEARAAFVEEFTKEFIDSDKLFTFEALIIVAQK